MSSKSNLRLKRSIYKYGLCNFSFIIFEYYDLSNNSKSEFLELETFYIQFINSKYLFNFKYHATSMLGYKHNENSKKKTKLRMNINHPMSGKSHSTESKLKIRGNKNPMFGKSYSIELRLKISHSNSIGKIEVYDINNNLINTFNNATLTANWLNIGIYTVQKYIKYGKYYKNKYKFIRLNKNS